MKGEKQPTDIPVWWGRTFGGQKNFRNGKAQEFLKLEGSTLSQEDRERRNIMQRKVGNAASQLGCETQEAVVSPPSEIRGKGEGLRRTGS